VVSKRQRIPVVLDTNVLVRALKLRSRSSLNQQIVRLWLIRKRLQLIVSADVIDEYLGVFRDVLDFDDDLLDDWRRRFLGDGRTTVVGLGRRYVASRDPDDNLMLSTAAAGRAEFLITNDRDLLDLPQSFVKSVRFRIVTPSGFFVSLDQGR